MKPTTQPDGSIRWPMTSWQDLLRRVLPPLAASGFPPASFRMGGGTCLATHLHHRVSYDIDLFFAEAGALRRLNPGSNAAIRALSERWQYPGHYIKIECVDGEIDFLPETLPDHPDAAPLTLAGLPPVRLERPETTIAKKLLFRGARLLPRDVFDTVAVLDLHPELLPQLRAAFEERRDVLERRLLAIAPLYRNACDLMVKPTAAAPADRWIDTGLAQLATAFAIEGLHHLVADRSFALIEAEAVLASEGGQPRTARQRAMAALLAGERL